MFWSKNLLKCRITWFKLWVLFYIIQKCRINNQFFMHKWHMCFQPSEGCAVPDFFLYYSSKMFTSIMWKTLHNVLRKIVQLPGKCMFLVCTVGHMISRWGRLGYCDCDQKVASPYSIHYRVATSSIGTCARPRTKTKAFQCSWTWQNRQ